MSGIPAGTSGIAAGWQKAQSVSKSGRRCRPTRPKQDALTSAQWRQTLTSGVISNDRLAFVVVLARQCGAVCQLLGLPDEKLILTVVLIQLVAIPGAMSMSFLSGKFGNLNVLMGIVFFWILICISAYFIGGLKEAGRDVEFYFYALAVSVGLVMGGIQALSRSTYSKLMPETKDTASFFSFYDVTEKIAIVIGIFTFGFIDETFGMKNSVLMLIVFFAFGFIALARARQKEKSIVQRQ